MTQAMAFRLIENELESARKKFPDFPRDPIHAAAVVAEESGELVRASLRVTYEQAGYNEMKLEAIQTAAMAIRFLLCLDDMVHEKSAMIFEADK